MRSFVHICAKCGLFLLSFIATAKEPIADNNVFSIRLKQAPLVTTMQQLAAEQNVNLIIDDEMEGTVSLQLENTDLDQLLRAVAKIKQLELWQENGIYYLSKGEKHSANSIAMNPPETVENLPVLDNIPTLSSTTIKLHFAKASEVMKSLTSGSGSMLSPNGSISFDERSNLLIIRDEKASIKNIKKLVAELDKPIEQIAIEARVVNISDESLDELGVRWGNVNFGTTNLPAASAAIQVARINGRLLDLELSALERENNVKIIASPKLLTTNKKSASIKQGTEIPYVSTNEKSGSQNVEFREAVLGLEVTPHISRDNAILLDLVVSQNAPGATIASGEGEVILIDKQEINTQVFAKDGETIVLGGVFQDTISKGIDKVPLLGDVPGLKHLFSRESERHQKRELVIFVTPHILKQGQTLQQLQQTREKPIK